MLLSTGEFTFMNITLKYTFMLFILKRYSHDTGHKRSSNHLGGKAVSYCKSLVSTNLFDFPDNAIHK